MSHIRTIDPAEAEGALSDAYARAKGPDGRVDNVLAVHGLQPEAMLAHLEVHAAAMNRPSPLSVAEREMIGVVVSRLNGCRYCLHHHVANLRAAVGEERGDLADRLATGRLAKLENREAAIVGYATKLTTNPNDMTAEDVERLRAAGLEDRAIHDVAHTVAYYAYANRIAQGLGVEIE